MKNLFFSILVLLIIACANPQKLSPTSMNDQELLRAYYETSNKADQANQESAAWTSRGNWVWSGITRVQSDQLNKNKIDLIMELKSRGIQP